MCVCVFIFQKERDIYFKGLVHENIEAGKSKIYRVGQLAGDREKSSC